MHRPRPVSCVPLLLAAAAYAGMAGAAERDPVATGHDSSLRTFRCTNGLPVALDVRPGTRTVFMEIGVRAGSRDEPDGRAGLAHLLEHLRFKEGHGETGRTNPAFSGLRASGAEINASTDFEQTEYHADVPADRFEEGWRALVGLVHGDAFTDEDVDRERNVVLQEVALGKTDPLAIMGYSVLHRLFPDDALGQPVIGFRKTLNAVTAEDLRAFSNRFYVPANMFAVVTGDVDLAFARRLVAETLGAMPAGTPRAPAPTPEPKREPLYRFKTLVQQSYLLTGAVTSGAQSPQAPSMELLSVILGEGYSSRLRQRLVEKEAVSDEILSVSFLLSDIGGFGAGVAVAPDHADAAAAALREELARLAREPVSQPELDSARARLRAGILSGFQTNEGRAGFRARRLFLGEDPALAPYFGRLDALTPDDLLKTAAASWGGEAGTAGGPMEIQVVPARGLGKLFAAIQFLIFKRL